MFLRSYVTTANSGTSLTAAVLSLNFKYMFSRDAGHLFFLTCTVKRIMSYLVFTTVVWKFLFFFLLLENCLPGCSFTPRTDDYETVLIYVNTHWECVDVFVSWQNGSRDRGLTLAAWLLTVTVVTLHQVYVHRWVMNQVETSRARSSRNSETTCTNNQGNYH